MGTRSTTHIFGLPEDSKTTADALKKLSPLVSMYQQYDGYPSGHGTVLAEFLDGMTIVNGFGDGTPAKAANGPGCFAAQLVKYLKDGIGGLYITTAEDRQEFNYFIYLRAEDRGWGPNAKVTPQQVFVVATDSDDKTIFRGEREAFAVWVRETT